MNIKKYIIIILVFITTLTLIGCNIENDKKQFTVTWKNENGDILEIDENVEYGTIPTYDGQTPTKSSPGIMTYVFNGWTPEITKVEADITYTATYIVEEINSYTVTWKNENGDILEIDENVEYGTIPTYDGQTPTKSSPGIMTYVFNGWTPEITKVEADITYTAIFKEIYIGEEIKGMHPQLSEDGKTIYYGLYPQTHVNNQNIINALNLLETTNINGWYLYNGEYYTKEKATLYYNESYTFGDGTNIVNGEEYWFKCEIISWKVLENKDGTYSLISSLLLDVQNYYTDYSNRTINNEIIYANNYEHSNIRNWLNNDFLNKAFTHSNANILTINVDNSSETTNANNNKYACSNTNDKVYLPSYEDLLNENIGFACINDKSVLRECKTTDYARAKGAWCNTRTDLGSGSLYNGTYWTRSASSEYYYCAWNVNSGGYLSSYAVDGDSHCVRPCITINITK